MCAVHIKLFIFGNIILKIDKIINIFSTFEEIFLKMNTFSIFEEIFLKIINYYVPLGHT